MTHFARFFAIVAMVSVPRANAATWVGNGGNSIDSKITVARDHIVSVLEDSYSESEFCVCPPEAEPSGQCQLLGRLSVSERKTCQQFLHANAKEILRVAADKQSVQVVPVNENLVLGERSVEAIAQFEKRQIIINEKSVTQLSPSELIALLAHEFGHLVVPKQTLIPYDKPLTDEKSFEGFEGAGGERRLLDAVGASLAVFAAMKESEPAPWDHLLWIGLAFSERHSNGKHLKENFLNPFSTGSALDITVNVSNAWNASFGLEHFTQTKSVFSALTARYTLSLVNLGVHYQFQPWASRASQISWSHLLFGAGVGTGTAEFSLDDGYVEDDTRVQVIAPWFEGKARIPLFFGGSHFWFVTSVKTSYSMYSKPVFELSEKNFFETQYMLGATYAF